MNVQEVETAARLGSNIAVLVWEDRGYGLISWNQDLEYKRHTNLSFGNPDWTTLAASFGWHGHHCDDSGKLATTLEAALGERGPSLVAMPVDYGENMRIAASLEELAPVAPVQSRRATLRRRWGSGRTSGWREAGGARQSIAAGVGVSHA